MADSPSDALVLFGVTGDLAHKMIFPALYALVKRGKLNVPIIGVAFPKWTLARVRKRVTDSIRRSGGIDNKRALRPTSVPVQLCQRGLQRPGHVRRDQEGAGQRPAPGALSRHPALAF